jgi:transcriptional regulator with XRE-family HTH domain
MTKDNKNICEFDHDISFGEKLELAMKLTGDNRTTLAAKIKVSEAMVRQYLAGTAYPKLNVFYRITKVMDIDAGWFLSEFDELHFQELMMQRKLAFVSGIMEYLTAPQQYLVMKQLISIVCKLIDGDKNFDSSELVQLTPPVINTALYLQQLPEDKRKSIIALYTGSDDKSG